MDMDDEGLTLRFVRRFSVAPEVVFDALTNPESMKIWWGDAEFDIDLRVGARWTVRRREGETEYTATGQYLEIERPRRLTYTFAMPQFSPNADTISIDIAPDRDGCVVTFEQAGEDIAGELRQVAPGTVSASEAGWQQGFDLMDAAWGRVDVKDDEEAPPEELSPPGGFANADIPFGYENPRHRQPDASLSRSGRRAYFAVLAMVLVGGMILLWMAASR